MGDKILAVVGSTASGKSDLAIALAQRCGGEIVCCDSMQIYKDMDIGTAKPTKEDLAAVPHHLFDFVEPDTPFSCADYIPLADRATQDILARDALPIFCGGTGLYLDRFLSGADFESTQIDSDFRREMETLARERGNGELHEMLRAIDPNAADEIHPNNVKRVIRALEIYRTSGRTKTELDRESREHESRYEALQIGIRYNDRSVLYDRIDRRVDAMLEAGLLAETERLLADGVFEKNSTAAQAIGYKELLPCIRGETDLDTAREALKTATRRYAKRQMTWFSSHGNVVWIDADGREREDIVAEAAALAEKFLARA